MNLENKIFHKWLELRQILDSNRKNQIFRLDHARLDQITNEFDRLQNQYLQVKGYYFNPVRWY